MKGLLYGFVLAVVVFLASVEGEKPCYNWPEDTASYKAACLKCKQESTETDKLNKCIYQGWNMTDKDGNVYAKTITDLYLLEENTSRSEAVAKAVATCSNDKNEPLTDRKSVDDIWNCSDLSVHELCPELPLEIKKWKSDEDMKGCMYQ